MRKGRNQRTLGKPCVSCPRINAVTEASRCHASDRVERSCPVLNRHAPFSWDKGDRQSRKRVSFLGLLVLLKN